MDHTGLQNKKGYFFDGYNLLVGEISGEGSAYFKTLSGKVIYSKPMYGFGRTWSTGYKYDKWEWRDFEFIPYNIFSGLENYLSFIKDATYDELKMYFKLKDIMSTDDFIAHNIKF